MKKIDPALRIVLLLCVIGIICLILLQFVGCKKEEPIIHTEDCITCSKTNHPTIDTCGTTQDMFTLSLELKQQGYYCQTKNK
jgi:hypothetical protein